MSMPIPSNDPWVVIEYEVMMFATLGGPILPSDLPDEIRVILSNAITESRILHVRNLCDILLPRKGEPDDIKLDALLGSIPPALQAKIDKLKTAYGHRNDSSSVC